MFTTSSFRRPLIAGLAVFSAVLVSAQTFSIPAKQIDIQGARYLKGIKKRVYLSPVNLEVMNWGKITAVTQTSALQALGGASNSTQRSTMEVAVPTDVAALRAVAGELYEDLATRLRAKGWEVITYDQAKGSAALAKASYEDEDPKLGAPMRKVTLGKQKMHYTIATPPGMPAFDWGMLMPFWGVRDLFKELDTAALEATYRFDPVALQGQSKRGLSRNSATTSAEANLIFTYGTGFLINSRGAGATLRLKSGVPVIGDIGEITKAADLSPNVANGLSKGLSFLAGGAITSQKGLYVCELDQAALKASLLLAGKAFNDEIIKGLASEG